MTPATGEVVVNTTDKTLHVGDGTTAGGTPLAKLASPAFTGNPTAPTPTAGDSDTSLATTAFVSAAIAAIPPATGMPAAVTGTLTTGSTAAFAVDFTTYSAYDLYLVGVTANGIATSLTVDLSSNGGTSFAVGSRSNSNTAAYDLALNNGAVSGLVGTIVQGGTSGGALLAYTGGYTSGGVYQSGVTRYATSAAVNQVRLALNSGSFTAGTVVLQPTSRR